MMRSRALLISVLVCLATVVETGAQELINPARPVPVGMAPGMQVKVVKQTAEETVYAVIFRKGDEVLSGLTDFAMQYKVEDAHFQGIGAVSDALAAWFDLGKKMYRPIRVRQQVEVLSMLGDIATFNGKPVVHTHVVLGKKGGTTVGGHLFEAHVQPTLEVFVTVDTTGLRKRADESGLKLIDPVQ